MNNRKRNKEKNIYKYLITLVITIVIGIVGYYCPELINTQKTNEIVNNDVKNVNTSELKDVPQYTDSSYVYINNNVPNFSESEYTTKPFEKYSELDSLGRCGVAYVNICKEIMPAEGEKRGDISSIKPSGWRQKKYNGEFLYNRCHLIGYQLTGENANENNLITCTRNTNTSTMLDMENKVTEYIKKTNNHVLYRVRAIYDGDNLLASGIQMEALSIEDNGKGIKFNIYIYNVQPGIKIDYKTGDSELEG